MNEIKRTERGWAGHFCCAYRCLFRRNTLLEYKDIKVIISTVGAMQSEDGMNFETIGYNRHYETMAFYSDREDQMYNDADVERPFKFDSKWSIEELGMDNEANEMHETVVEEIAAMLTLDTIAES